ncbi:hypothetical protein ACLOAV_009645 [Pseudogymnoascus australis]
MSKTSTYDAEWLEVEKALGSRPCFLGDVSEIRTQFAASGKRLRPLYPKSNPIVAHDAKINARLKVRIYKPQGQIGADVKPSKLPIGVYFHGGGFIMGDLDTEDADCRYFAQNTPCVVVSVDYRLAPEAEFRDILEDCVAGYEWSWENAATLGGDQDLVFAIGESAGACLALQVTNTLIDAGRKSKVQGVVVLCPITAHPTTIPERYRNIYSSYGDNAKNVPLVNKTVMETFIAAANLNPNNPSHFVTLSKNLREFPPTFIITAEKDPLRDDGVLLETILLEEGVKVKRQHYDGFGHVFWIFPMLEKRNVLLRDATEGIKFVLGSMGRHRPDEQSI